MDVPDRETGRSLVGVISQRGPIEKIFNISMRKGMVELMVLEGGSSTED